MIRTRTWRREWEWELLRWLALITLAGSLLTIFATRASGEKALPGAASSRLPPTAPAWPGPLRENPTAAEGSPGSLLPAPAIPGADRSLVVWRALELQRARQWDLAFEAWRLAELHPAAEAWRSVALGHIWRRQGQLEPAEKSLERALSQGPENAVVHYELGMLRAAQAERAFQWPDAQGEGGVYLASYAVAPAPNSRSTMRFAALAHFQKAIRYAPHLRPEQPLTAPAWAAAQAPHPTVGDLLLAIEVSDVARQADKQLAALRARWREPASSPRQP